MSSEATTTGEEPVVRCEFCGFVIDEEDKQCPALDDGRCQP